MKPGRLTKRAEFLNVRKGVRAARPFVTIEAAATHGVGARVGYTATKRIGAAVTRNRAKRRLRAAVHLLAADIVAYPADYVFIARHGTANAPWAALLDDVGTALLRVRSALAARAASAASPSSRNGPRRKDK